MKQVLVYEGSRTEIIESPIPTPKPHEVIIKVHISGSNPKDWKTWWAPELPVSMGDDIAGTVHEVGRDVTCFKAGDRVFAFHEVHSPHGSYAEYAVAHAYTTAHLPGSISFEEAATVPLAALTASLALYSTLNLPQPWFPASSPVPILIYGGSSAVGAFAIKLAMKSNLHPIIAVAGAGKDYVSSLLDTRKGDTVLDYRVDRRDLEAGIRSALVRAGGFSQFVAVLDAICQNESANLCFKFLQSQGTLAHVLPLDDVKLTEGKRAQLVIVGEVHGGFGDKPGARDFGFIMMQLFARGLDAGWLKGHLYEVVPGGLQALPTILGNLEAGKNSALKYVLRISETEGL